ncbi:hypothetical protein [Winogradskya humida]|uniref:Esterase n=1 Tax=Winogradskya humida TaxID=113566 RepID=A0ABQ3ZZ74_9ACTN|nr:hypothetical protein [Actinoplanes humidus]GIE23877.1 hypothetical protein Ahu01nite_069790 [Actinoplanes humidus]
MDNERGNFLHTAGYRLDYLVTVPEKITSPYLQVLFHGFSRIEKHVPPVFARRQWPGADEAVCLFVSDPIHNHNDVSCCGWFLLGEDEFLPRILDLHQHLRNRFGLGGTVWHGLSSGGYAALKYCIWAGEGLAFVVAPHNDPEIVPQWQREAAPFAVLPAMAKPAVITDLLGSWDRTGTDQYLYAVMTEHDSYFALHHLKPIMTALDFGSSASAVALRDGRDHGFLADADYARHLAAATGRWEQRRSRRAEVSAVTSD